MERTEDPPCQARPGPLHFEVQLDGDPAMVSRSAPVLLRTVYPLTSWRGTKVTSALQRRMHCRNCHPPEERQG